MSQGPRTVEGVPDASPTVVTQAFVYALDPSPEQESSLLSHIGASRFAYNHLLHRVLANWDENRTRKEAGEEVTREDYLSTNHFGLLYQWAEIRDHVAPWWKENGASAYNDAAQRLSRALSNFYAGRARAPHYRRRGVGESVRFMGQSVRPGRHAPRTHQPGRRGEDLRVDEEAGSSPRARHWPDRRSHGLTARGPVVGQLHR